MYNLRMLVRGFLSLLAVVICSAVGAFATATPAAAHAGNDVAIDGRTYSLDEGYVQPDGVGSLGTYYCFENGVVVHSHSPEHAANPTAFRTYDDSDALRLCRSFMYRVNILSFGHMDVWLGRSVGFSINGIVRYILILAVAWIVIRALLHALRVIRRQVAGGGRLSYRSGWDGFREAEKHRPQKTGIAEMEIRAKNPWAYDSVTRVKTSSHGRGGG